VKDSFGINLIADRAFQLAKLLDYRQFDLMNSNTASLARIGQLASSQRDHLKSILEESKADSSWTKVFSFIATMHLPANLIAVSAHL
jgi:hypothetical protein